MSSSLSKLAAIHNLAVIVISQSNLSASTDRSAILRPTLQSKTWTDNISTRLVVFRDFARSSEDASGAGSVSAQRFVGVVKSGGMTYERLEKAVPFVVGKTGVVQSGPDEPAGTQNQLPPSHPRATAKRKRDAVEDSQSDEELGSDDDDFSWVEEDVVLEEPIAATTSIAEADEPQPEAVELDAGSTS